MRLARLQRGGFVVRTPQGRIVEWASLPVAKGAGERVTSIVDLLADPGSLEQLEHDLGLAEDCPALPDTDPGLATPVDRPGKIFGVSLNYADYCARAGLDRPTRPKVFAKLPNTLVDPGGAIVIPDGVRVSYEGELAVVIGRHAHKVRGQAALDAVAGYTIYNDVTAVDLVREDGQLLRGKNLDTFGPMGPWLVTPDEVEDPEDLALRTVVDGEVRQASRTSEMIFGIAELVEFFSTFCTLEPGDVIATGTPEGTATQHQPPAFLEPGQVVSIEIEGLGVLQNDVTRVD